MSVLPQQTEALRICDKADSLGISITENQLLRDVLYECYPRGFFNKSVKEDKLREITWVWLRIRWVLQQEFERKSAANPTMESFT